MPNDTTLTLENNHKIGRRGFLAAATGGLSLGFFMPDPARVLQAKPAAAQQQINSYVRIGTDGSITLEFGGSEMGQGVMSGLAQILAEELMVDWTQISVEQALADPAVSYITGGSNAVASSYTPLRTAGATARELLISAAVVMNGDPNRANYAAKSATVVYTNPTTHATTTWGYGALAATAALQPVPSNIPLTDPSRFRLIGQRVPRVDIPSKTNGSAKYGIDTFIPGMVFAAIKHCPTIGGVMSGTPSKPSGAIAVVPCSASDSRGAVVAGRYNAVAVVATDTWTARNLARQLKVTWTLPPSTSSVDSTQLLTQAQQMLASGPAMIAEPTPPAGYTPSSYAPVIEAQVAAAMGTPTIDAVYTFPHLAHATMEVLNCSVNITFSNGVPVTCEIWAPTQAATWVTTTATTITGLQAPQIIVHTTLLGGGLGRKIEQDYVSQALQVAMAVKRPVKLTWFREEDFAHDQYRPMAVVEVKAKLNAGAITAWSYRNVSASILGQRGWSAPDAVDSQATEGSTALPYALGTFLTEWVPLPAGIPLGFWRSVGNSINAFAIESMIDELAKAAGQDPFTFRYNIMTDPRGRAVLAAADTLSSWRKTLPTSHGWGMAITQSFGTWVCEVMDITATTSSIRVNRVACVVDCGFAINPDSVEAQMQGGIVHGLNAALWGQITFTNGVANQTNFNKYKMMRPGDMPQVTVQILASPNPPSGTGEPAVPPAAPALANAYFKLTGKRVRTLPFFPGATMGDI